MSAEPSIEPINDSFYETPGFEWPKDKLAEAHDIVVKFGGFALEADNILQSGTFENNRREVELTIIKEESVRISSLLLGKIPLQQFKEPEGRQAQDHQDSDVIELRPDSEEVSEATRDFLDDRYKILFRDNLGNRLTYDEIVLAIYPEEVAKGGDIRILRQRVSKYLTPSYGQRKLRENGIKIDKVPIKTADRKVRLAVVPYGIGDSEYQRAGGKEGHWVENVLETDKEIEKKYKLFRSSAERTFPQVPKIIKDEDYRPVEGQPFVTKNPERLLDLLTRGIITPEQYQAEVIDLAAVVALLIITKGEDIGFLDGKMTPRGMEIIRNEEKRYFERLRGAEGGKKKTGRPPQD